MQYLLLVADSFRESAIDELRRACSYSIIKEQHNLIIAELKNPDTERIASAKFIYSYFPLQKSSLLDSKNYMCSIKRAIISLGLDRHSAIKLECFDINCKQGYSAKDIEVAVGSEMERTGYNIDIIHPEILAYCVLMDSECYSGYVDLYAHDHGSIDPFRYNKEKVVSRSEFKIMEAFAEFRLAAPDVVIDLGASPGGWSYFLAKNGSAVAAVDSGALDNESMEGVMVRVMRNPERARLRADSLKKRGIVHMKCTFDRALASLSGIKADMLTDDMNMGGIDSSEAVIRYSRLLKKDGLLLMTVKCMRRNVGRYIKEVEALLEPKFVILRWKVLPHNRQEITLLARRRPT
jgi:23S rRNA U2552 (ribose-2'-O)-methylase RlmE/FtsJ